MARPYPLEFGGNSHHRGHAFDIAANGSGGAAGLTDLGPAVPANWYLIGPASRIANGAVTSHCIGPHAIVAWRPAGGDPVAMAGHCAHMGCHLGDARVLSEGLRCPLHFRVIAPDGRFAGGGLRQPLLPLREYLGGLFVWLGDPAAAWDLAELDLAGNACRHAGSHGFALPWQWLIANGLDIEHLSAVHDRQLLEMPVQTIAGKTLSVAYRTRPSSGGLADRIMAGLARDGIRGRIRAVGGTMMVVEADLTRWRTFILLSFIPDPAGGTLIRGMAGIKGAPTLARRAATLGAARLFRAFLAKDLGVLDRIRWHEPARAESLGDRFTRATCDWMRSLPGA